MVNIICTIQQSHCSFLEYDNTIDIGRISVSPYFRTVINIIEKKNIEQYMMCMSIS